MLWDVAWRNLSQRWLRSLLTILGVAAAVQLYSMMTGISFAYERDLQDQLSAFAGKVFVQQPMGVEGQNEDFPSPSSSIEAETAAALLDLESIDRARSSALLFVPLARSSAPNQPPAVLAVGIEPGHESAFLGGFKVETGVATLADPHSVILGRQAAEHYQEDGSDEPVGPGQTIEILGQSFTVIGVLKSAPNLFSRAVLMPLATAQDLFNRPNAVSAVVIAAARIEELETVKATVEDRFPGLQASGQEDIAQNADEILEMQRIFFTAIQGTAILVSVIIITIVVVVAVMEQRREIGTLRAIGARRRAIFGLVISESLTLSLIGVVVALPLALITNLALPIVVASDLLPGWLGSIAAAVAIGVLASLLPAWQAMRVDPIEALRYE